MDTQRADVTRNRTAAETQPPVAVLITIDTEGDNLWAQPRTVTTRNADFLARFQNPCERYGLKPTWLANWEMAHSPVFCEMAADALRRGTAEVGMHLHAWNTPPLEPITEDDFRLQPLLIQYPTHLMREKILRTTDRLESVFEVKMLSHRAGRWGMNETYARLLVEQGYLVDSSVTPNLSWRGKMQNRQVVGCDYTNFPDFAYRVDLGDLSRPGDSHLLEIPMTIVPGPDHCLARAARRAGRCGRFPQRLADRLFPPQRWFRPNRHNRRDLVRVLRGAGGRRADYVQMMMHSSELMPGGSPLFPTEHSIERLYDSLEELFALTQEKFVGMTLAEYWRRAGASRSPVIADADQRSGISCVCEGRGGTFGVSTD